MEPWFSGCFSWRSCSPENRKLYRTPTFAAVLTVSWNLLTQVSYIRSYSSWCIFSGSLSKTRLQRASPRLTTITWLRADNDLFPHPTKPSCAISVAALQNICTVGVFSFWSQALSDNVWMTQLNSVPLCLFGMSYYQRNFPSDSKGAGGCRTETFSVEMSRYWNVLVWCLSCIYLYLLLTYWMSSINQCTIKCIACTGGWGTTRPTWQRRPYGRSF